MDKSWPSLKPLPRPDMTSGRLGSATARRNPFSVLHSTRVCHSSPGTAFGWHISRMNPAGGKSTCSRIPAPAGDGKSRRKGAGTSVGPEWAGAVLPQRRPDNGRGATHPSFTAGKPRVLFEGHYVPPPGTSPNYDVSPDGQRFLMIKPNDAGDAAAAQINVVLNWLEELKRLAPTGKE
jgi:hypothetical protein